MHERFRRRGVGRTLLDEAVERSSSLEITALTGLIFGHNEASLQLFARAGFVPWGVLPRVARVDGIERDIVIVGRHLV